MRFATWLAGGVWIGSWYLMYLEVTRWHHVKPSLAFKYDIAPGARPGQPLILLYIASIAAPLVVGLRVITLWSDRRTMLTPSSSSTTTPPSTPTRRRAR